MKYFEIAVCAALGVASIPWAAAHSVSQTQVSSHPQPIRHYHPLKAGSGIKTGSGKSLHRSTVAAGRPAVATGTSASTHRSEIDRLEHQTAAQLQAESKHQVRPAAVGHVAHSGTPGHGSGINFSYHHPSGHQTSRSSASGGRQR
jgi:hypothetical protein